MINQPGNYIDFSGQRKKDRQVLLNISRKLNACNIPAPYIGRAMLGHIFFRSTDDKYAWLFLWDS